MQWFLQLFLGIDIAQSIVVLSLAVVLGLGLGHIRIRGVGLGAGGVLFSGLALAHFGFSVDKRILEFMREFGLILFVFSIGMQVGPGFVDSLRRRGLYLNIAATLVALLGFAAAIIFSFLFDLTPAVTVGLLSGAVTNTPSLAAASQVLAEIFPQTASTMVNSASLAYALAYPCGILGILLTMLLVRLICRINPEDERIYLEKLHALQHPPLVSQTFVVSNPNAFGMRLEEIAGQFPPGVVVSRVKLPEDEQIHVPSTGVVLHENMLVHAVGKKKELAKLRLLLGPPSPENLQISPGPLGVRKLLVTRTQAAGKNVQSLGLTPESGITVTRIFRAGIEFTPGPGIHLHFGDKLLCVGEQKDLDRAALVLGNSTDSLEHPHIVPIFLGILLGVILGSIPIAIPGLPSGIKLGLAGGPLLAAIILSRINHFAGMVWYLPMSANLILRETGIALFLACVGLYAGAGFIDTLTQGSGLSWVLAGACITFFPLFITALLVRILFRYDYAAICGLLAGSMTDPPALAFSVQMLGSDAPSSVYATVYPLTMILRILFAQILVLVLYYLI